MRTGELLPRLVEPRLVEALGDTPVVVVHGPRQCGKTTLARRVGDRLGYAYFTFDDETTRAAATADPVGFVDALPQRAVLDEVQRVPGLFPAIKNVVDRDRRPGRLLLTGSSNVLLLPTLSDSLAGRMGLMRLHPLAQSEIERRPSRFLDSLFAADFPTRRTRRLGPELAARVATGGFPPALAHALDRRRAAWYRDYIEALVQRDARALARIASLDALPRLLALAASHTATLVNVSDLAAPFQISRPTIRDYLTLLARLFLVDELPPWHTNRLSRLVKTPKLHIGDTGIACALLAVDATALHADRSLLGALVETFVFQELRRLASRTEDDVRFFHFRDRDGAEVDLVLERSGQVAGVETKAGATVTASDFRSLRKLREAAGKRFAGGVVLHDGETTVGFGDGLFAVPIRALWEIG